MTINKSHCLDVDVSQPIKRNVSVPADKMSQMRNSQTNGAIRVLHVDDSHDYLLLAKYRLKKMAKELSIEWAESGEAALDALQGRSYTCIVCDMNMPDMDGLRLLRAVRERGDHTPFIFLSANNDDEIARRVLENGAHDYCAKEIGQGYFIRLLDSIRRAARAKARAS